MTGDNSEFSVIDRLFKPLAGLTAEARGLIDDVAVLGAREGYDLVVTTDAMVEGVHFLSTDPLDLVARKLLRVNISDLVAKGADPYGYQLLTAWPKGMAYEGKEIFAAGLRVDQDEFDFDLFGGDTVSTDGPLLLAITAFGHAPTGRTLSRAGARVGDRVLVGGFIGDAHLGLRVLRGEFDELSDAHKAHLIKAYRLPQPRDDMADTVLENAHASMDISDGLIADATHLAKASEVRIVIDLDRVPTSDAARAAMVLGADAVDLVTGGDDYQMLCTASAAGAKVLIAAGFVEVGQCEAGEGVDLVSNGQVLELEDRGWVHG
ncbi:thiamine-phosphate kinase [Asticcacaulis sp. YBE204]|uniref:thiamine-phosphate kinase n=1 Tax=Asticcacaulis sp. YBE204 TaxID=1282363 RepID=UPI0003C3F856|nr:thiamine-phosphate kinase [Asticcacaulis sp. YBE204]ESQ78173.1 thiamine-monophosphate kinase [Asticcacaulis sp. YBE204]